MATTIEPSVNTTDTVNASQTHSPAAGSNPPYHPFRVREYKSEAEMKASYLAIHRRLFPPIRRVDIVQNEAPQEVEVHYIEPDPTPPPAPPQALPSNPRSWEDFDDPIVTLRDIKVVVLREYNISLEFLLSHRRKRHIVQPRQVAIWLAYQLTSLSLVSIGKRFGGFDHTTVMHACDRVERMRLACNYPRGGRNDYDHLAALQDAVKMQAAERQKAEKVV